MGLADVSKRCSCSGVSSAVMGAHNKDCRSRRYVRQAAAGQAERARSDKADNTANQIRSRRPAFLLTLHRKLRLLC